MKNTWLILLSFFFVAAVNTASAKTVTFTGFQYSSKATSSWRNLAQSSIPIHKLRFGDFDGDRKTDVFRTNGKQWFYSKGGKSRWIKLGKSRMPIHKLRFGDFNGDGKTDVFRTNGKQWFYSSAGKGRWTKLAKSKTPLKNLRFGDFDGDGKTDVFRTNGKRWFYSSAGKKSWKKLAGSRTPLKNLRFGDFDGDGKTDVFKTSGKQWYYSSAGKLAWKKLARSTTPIHKLRFGDFNGDKKTDVFQKAGKRWKYSSAGKSRWKNLGKSAMAIGKLRFGDFNGDKKTDVFRTVKKVKYAKKKTVVIKKTAAKKKTLSLQSSSSIQKKEILISTIGTENSGTVMSSHIYSKNEIINIDGKGFGDKTEIHFSYKDYTGVNRDKKVQRYSVGSTCIKNCLKNTENRIWVEIPYLFGHADVMNVAIYVNNGLGSFKSNSIIVKVQPTIIAGLFDVRKINTNMVVNSTKSTDSDDQYKVLRVIKGSTERWIQKNSGIEIVHRDMKYNRRAGSDSIADGLILKNNWEVVDVRLKPEWSDSCSHENVILKKVLDHVGTNNMNVKVEWSAKEGGRCQILKYKISYFIKGPIGLPYI